VLQPAKDVAPKPVFQFGPSSVATAERDQIAHRYGFDSFAELLAASFRLPRIDGELMQCFLVRRPDGSWFLWKIALDFQESGSVEYSSAGV
jgi:hypothetical protein